MMPLLVMDQFAIEDNEPFVPLRQRLRDTQQKVRWTVTIQGSVVKFKKTGGVLYIPPSRANSEIGPMSRNSRLRLLAFINKIDHSQNPSPAFVTLTYPDTVVHRDYRRRSTDRFLFLRYLEKHRSEKTPSVWRVEWKPRKTGRYVGKLMPHWHLFLLTVKQLNEDSVREMWRKSIGHDDTYLDVDVRFVEGPEAAAKYVAKYCSKQYALGITAYHNSGFRFGRHWGITRKAMIPLQPVVVSRELTEDEVDCVQQFAPSIWPTYDKDVDGGFTLLSGKMAKEWKEFLE